MSISHPWCTFKKAARDCHLMKPACGLEGSRGNEENCAHKQMGSNLGVQNVVSESMGGVRGGVRGNFTNSFLEGYYKYIS